MNKKKLLIIVAVAVVALLIAIVIFFSVTKGKVEQKDGLLQNSRIYVENIYVKDRTLYYTVVNKSWQKIFTGADPHVQKKVDGRWETVTLGWISRDLGWRLDGFYEGEQHLEIEYPQNLTVGEYRLVFGSFASTKEGLVPYGDGLYIVGYFTVSEPIPMEYGIFEEKDGILQNTHVKLEIATKELNAPVTKLGYSLLDLCDFSVERQKYTTIENYEDLLEVFEDGVWKQAPSFGEIIRQKEDGGDPGRVEKNPCAHNEEGMRMVFWKPEQIAGGYSALMDKRYVALTAGQYRLRVKYTLHTEDESVEIPEGQLEAVAYFNVTAPAE